MEPVQNSVPVDLVCTITIINLLTKLTSQSPDRPHWAKNRLLRSSQLVFRQPNIQFQTRWHPASDENHPE